MPKVDSHWLFGLFYRSAIWLGILLEVEIFRGEIKVEGIALAKRYKELEGIFFDKL